MSLYAWFLAAWIVTVAKDGRSALGLSQELGCSYKTAWNMLHKLREAMRRRDPDKLTEAVEVDETKVGGVRRDRQAGRRTGGRQTDLRAWVAIGVEVRYTVAGRDTDQLVAYPGRVRMQVIPDTTANSLSDFVVANVDPRALVVTDQWVGYNRLSRLGFDHLPINLSQEPGHAHELLPLVHRVASLLKRWLESTHQGAPLERHLDAYLAEFTFRFNRKRATHRGQLFYRLIEDCLEHAPVPERRIVGGL
jgi:hypothetical protein